MNSATGKPRIFWLMREVDVSGVSGKGIVAEGVCFHDGQCVLSWFGEFHTLGISPSIEEVEKIHGHNGSTKIVWGD